MKKKLLIILIGMILLSPCCIKANHGSPATVRYKAVVTKKEGLECKDEKIPYGSIIEVEESYDIEDTLFLRYIYNDLDCFDDISYKDFELYNKDFNIMDYNNKGITKFPSKLDVTVISSKGIKLYKGPAKKYDIITTIPNRTKLYAEYYVDNEEGMPWLYVTYNGKSGWIYNVDYETVYGYTKEKAIVITFDDDMSDIKQNTIIDEYYCSGISTQNKYYVKYNDKMYFVYNLGFPTNETIKLKKDVEFKETLAENSKVISKIKKGTTLKAEFTSGDDYSDYYYITYNGKKGWIVLEELDDEITDEDLENDLSSKSDIEKNYKENINIENVTLSSNEIKVNEKINVNIKINNNSNTKIDKILLVFKNKSNENKLIYLKDIDATPYIDIDSKLFENGEFNLEYIRLEMNDTNKTKVLYSVNDIKNKSNYKLNVINKKNVKEEENNNTEETKKKIEEIHKINNTHLYIGIGSAISITITSIILIILINKRRKNKSKK